MRKINVILSFIVMFMILFIPVVVDAAEVSRENTIYGTITVDESEWSQSGDTYSFTQVFYITKSTEYVYFNIKPVLNVTDVQIVASSSAFKVVSQKTLDDGSVNVLLKANNSAGVNNTKTEVFTVVAKIVDPSKLECNLSYSPLSVACAVIENNYFDDNGSIVSEEEYNQACNGVIPDEPDEPSDEPNPETGSVIPYVAVGGGLLAIAGVYLYSRKSDKMYKI